MNTSPALTIIGSFKSTQPPSPTVAVANRPSRSPVAASSRYRPIFQSMDCIPPVRLLKIYGGTCCLHFVARLILPLVVTA
jgi:hypothetical protein